MPPEVPSSACEWWTETAERFEPCPEPRRPGNARYCERHFLLALQTMRLEQARHLQATERAIWEAVQVDAARQARLAEARAWADWEQSPAAQRAAALERQRMQATQRAARQRAVDEAERLLALAHARDEAKAVARVRESRRRLEAAREAARAAARDRRARQQAEDAQLAADRFEWRVLGRLEDAPPLVEAYTVVPGYDRVAVDYRATLADEQFYAEAYELLTWRDEASA